MKKDYKLATLAVRGGHVPDHTGAANMPIYPSTAFIFEDSVQAANRFDLKELGNIYTRINNPTNDAFADRINLLDGGAGALSLSSGQSATLVALTTLASASDHILSVSTLYGGTHSLFTNTFKKYGIEVTFVDPEASEDEILAKVRDNTKAIFAETVGNPRMNLLDLDKIAAVAKKADLPFVLDNTFTTPALIRAKDHGVNIVVYSATKYLGGHGNAMGGVIVDLGNFDWDNGKFPGLVEPDSSYHGIRFYETFGPMAFILKARVCTLRDIGTVLSPFNAWILSMGVETLPLRMEKHSENGRLLADFLEDHPAVSYVLYPGSKTDPHQDRAKKYLPHGAAGMLAFGIKGGAEAGERFINTIDMADMVTNLGDTRTIVTHPASTTHRQLSADQQEEAGVSADMIRVSVGIEDIDDIIRDFDEALKKSVQA